MEPRCRLPRGPLTQAGNLCRPQAAGPSLYKGASALSRATLSDKSIDITGSRGGYCGREGRGWGIQARALGCPMSSGLLRQGPRALPTARDSGSGAQKTP